MSQDVIVIGAGVGGLTAAAILARAGRRVLVLERGAVAGGQSAAIEFAPGFHAAPLAPDADWLPAAVARAAGITTPARVVPEVPAAVPAGDREWLTFARDADATADAIRHRAPGDASQWPGFARRLTALTGFLESLYLLPPPDIEMRGLRELMPLLGLGRRLRGLGPEGMVDLLRVMPMPVQEFLDEQFECEPLKAAIGACGTTDLRQGPRSGGTAFVMLHHHVGAAGVVRGRGYWQEGPGALAEACAASARRAGATIRTGAAVSEITVHGGEVQGVVLESGEAISAPRVLSGADPARTFLGLIDPVWLDPEFLLAVRNIRFRGCTSHLLLALETAPVFPGLSTPAGVLSLSPTLTDQERAADAAKYGEVSARPHVELRVPSLRWQGLAPSGQHVMVASIRWTPYRPGGREWTVAQRDGLIAAVLAQIEAVAPGFSGTVKGRLLLTPADLEERFGLTEGAVTHGEMALDQILFMRPVAEASRYATPVPGLFLCGSGCHPGTGAAAVSGWLAASRMLSGAR